MQNGGNADGLARLAWDTGNGSLKVVYYVASLFYVAYY